MTSIVQAQSQLPPFQDQSQAKLTPSQLSKVGHWLGDLQLSMGLQNRPEHSGMKTIIANKRQLGPYTVQRPFYPEGEVCHLILLHPPGGLVEGDCLSLFVDCGKKTKTFITTPSAAKVYSCDQFDAQQTQLFDVHDEASLEWFPQEMIAYNASMSSLTTTVNLHGNAKFSGWEITCFGRALANDYFEQGHLRQTIRINRDTKPLFIDRLNIDNQVIKESAWGLNGFSVTGTFVLTNCDQHSLELAQSIAMSVNERDDIEATVGATLIDDILVCRGLAQQSRFLKSVFTEVWQGCRQSVLSLPPLTPRIWNT